MVMPGQFVCRSCLISLWAYQRRPQWASVAAAATAITTTAATTAPSTARTLSASRPRPAAPPRRGIGGGRRLHPAAGRTPKTAASRPGHDSLESMGSLDDIAKLDPDALDINKLSLDDLEGLLAQVEESNADVNSRNRDMLHFFDQQQDGSLQEFGLQGKDGDGPTKASSSSSSSSWLDDEIDRQLAEVEDKLRETAQLARQRGKKGGSPLTAKRPTDRLRPKYAALRAMIQDVEAECAGEGAGEGEVEGGEEREGGEEEEEEATQKASRTGLSNVKVADVGLSSHARRHVQNLNKVLRPAARRLLRAKHSPEYAPAIDDRIITAVWSRYGAARTGLAEAWGNVPGAAWTVLWEVLAWEPSKPARRLSAPPATRAPATATTLGPAAPIQNPRRMPHIYYLAKDMQAAGVALSDSQQLLAMEAMFVEGWPATALDNWKRWAPTLGTRPETATDYWELGVRMCALHGDVERAERAAEKLFGSLREPGQNGQNGQNGQILKRPNPMVLLPLIRSAAARDDLDLAIAGYRRFKTTLEKEKPGGMAIEDYDEAVSCFLAANQTEQAFAVFVDMMFGGAVDVRKKGGPILPAAVDNQFFVGKWLKRLIGAGDLNGALQVLQLMQSRGVMVAAVQVNGLLGAWLRSGMAANQERADALAWQMIESRRLFVDLRRREKLLDWRIKLMEVGPRVAFPSSSPSSASSPPTLSLTFVPRATVETFILMAENYKNRGQISQLERLWVAFQECEMVRPGSTSSPSRGADAFLMNQLLESYVHDNRPVEARDMYSRMVNSPVAPIAPNSFTFLALFRSLDVHRLMLSSLSDSQRAVAAQLCRQLFREMVTRLRPHTVSSPEDGQDRQDGVATSATSIPPSSRSMRITPTAFDSLDGLQALARLVLHGFRKTGDYAGLVVAVRALPPLLDDRFYITKSLAIELVAESPTDLARDTPVVRRRILRAGELVDSLLIARQHMRHEAAASDQDRAEWMSSATSKDELSQDLAAVIAHYYRTKCSVDDDAFETMYAAAVDDLGVKQLMVDNEEA